MKDTLTTQKKYNAWKSKSNGDPIDGTDIVLNGISKRSVIKHLAYIEGVKHQHNDMIVRLPDGNFWCITQI